MNYSHPRKTLQRELMETRELLQRLKREKPARWYEKTIEAKGRISGLRTALTTIAYWESVKQGREL